MTMILDRAFASTRAVLAQVKPDQLGSATPCAAWDVRALIDHFVGSARWAAAMVDGTEQTGHVLDDFDLLAAHDESRAVALAAFRVQGALDRNVRLPFGEFTGARLMGFAATDQFTHGWDLARALGLPTDLDPELATALLTRARVEVTDAYRGVEGRAPFRPAVEAPVGANPADRLAAFLGRAV